MREHRKFPHILQQSHYFLSILVVFLFLCAEFDNPVDPEFKGPYDFRVLNLNGSDSLSIFQPCTIAINDLSGKDTYHYFSCAVEKDKVAIIKKLFDTNFVIIFYKPCTTTVYVNGIRPNDSKDSKEIKFFVVNPYSIAGKDTVAYNDTDYFFVRSTDTLSKNFSGKFEVRWFSGKETKELPKDSSYKFSIKDTSQGSVTLRAGLFSDSTPDFPLYKRVVLKGWAPKIHSTRVCPLDTSKTVINQVDSFKVVLSITDKDKSHPYTVSIRSIVKENSEYRKKVTINQDSGECSITLPPITKVLKDILLIEVEDSQKYRTFDTVSVSIQPVTPKVIIDSSIDVAINKRTEISVESSINCAKFVWVLLNDQVEKRRDTTTTGSFTFGPIDSIGEFTLKVKPLSGTGDTGLTQVCKVTVKEFKYSTVIREKIVKDIFLVKVNRIDTLHAFVRSETAVLPDSAVKNYLWTYPPQAGPFILSAMDSICVLKCSDSIAPFTIVVTGSVDSDGDAIKDEMTVKVCRFSPKLQITENYYDTIVNSTIKFKYSIEYTDPESAQVTALYYRFKSPHDTSVFPYDTSKGIQFNDTGLYNVEMWCVDADSAVSAIDSVPVKVVADLPFLTKVPEKIVVAINKNINISGIIAKSGTAGHPIKNFSWDLNNDGVYDTITLTGDIELQGYSQPAKDTIAVKCIDTSGEGSIPSIIYIDIFSDKPKINSCVLKDTVKKYINTPVELITRITDPDDSMLFLTISANDIVFNDSVRNNLDTTRLRFSKAGSYTVTIKVSDKNNNKDTFFLSAPLVIDSGLPVISNFSIHRDSVFINDSIRCSITANDPNGSIKEYRYYINSIDSTPVIKNNDSAFVYTFKEPGTYKVYAVVNDTDNYRSLVKYDSVVVRRGQPVVDSLSVDSKSIFVNDSCMFKMMISDVNGKIIKKELKWNDKKDSITVVNYTPADAKQSFTDTITHTFTVNDTSIAFIQLRVMDDDSIYSEWKACSLSVKKGEPRIDSIKIDPQGLIYVKDSIKLTVTASDTNLNLKTVLVLWQKNGTFDTLSAIGSGKFQIFNKKFAIEDSLIDTIHIRAVDETNFNRDSLYKFNVLVGRPVIDTVKPHEVWVNESKTFTITAHDNKGVDSFAISFDNGISWDGNKTGSFLKNFNDTSASSVGIRQIKTKVWDNDGFFIEKAFNLNVKLGRPVVGGLNNYGNPKIQWKNGSTYTTDTMFYQWAPGQATEVVVDSTDSNGTCVRYFWDWESIDFIDTTTTVPKLNISGLRSNQTNRVTVTCKDNDSIRSSPYPFFVFPDGPPTAPQLGSITMQGDSVKFVWVNSDLKDGDSTLFQIQCDANTTPVTVIKSFGTCKKSGTDFYYWFKPTTTGRYYWKVTAKDARGSTSECIGTPYFDFVKP
ncbi:MAG TPA: hypothetical protein VHO70_14335 [Chitinispirillaceae bacterium]|nr:hypothetical protein [Chitinispirillaceae bacterium]